MYILNYVRVKSKLERNPARAARRSPRRNDPMFKRRIGFLGAGNMAEAIADALLDAAVARPEQISACDISPQRRSLFHAKGARVTEDPAALLAQCDVLIIAVKPQNLPDILPVIGPLLTPEHLLITICAGIPTTRFEAAAATPIRVVRVMPNTPIRVRLGAAALCKGAHATDDDILLAARIFGTAGTVVRVEEQLMDAVTALSGSGPAYFYALVEALTDAGKENGLSEQTARELAIQTARGAAEMMARSSEPPDELRRRVTSKGGTTEAALRVMAEGNLRETVIAAVAAAVRRGRELAQSR